MKNKILIILTSHRLDCFWLCMRCLETNTDLSFFNKIYILANEVSEEHAHIINSYKKKYKSIIDIHCSPRGLGGCVIAMQNIVLEQHKNDIIVKIDEDVFVTKDWITNLYNCYEKYINTNAIIFSPTIPNNYVGRAVISDILKQKFTTEYNDELSTKTVHQNYKYGEWIWKKVISDKLVEHILSKKPREMVFKKDLNINCILFDDRLTKLIHPFRYSDEAEINNKISTSIYHGIMTTSCLVHHYSFGPQQSHIDLNIGIDSVAEYMKSTT